MISSFESVTVGVSDPAAALLLFRDALGLPVITDTRASVGLLSAWNRPAHESARLIELGGTAAGEGRLRLAHYESGASWATRRDSGSGAIDAPASTGPKAVGIRAARPLAGLLEKLGTPHSARGPQPLRHSAGGSAAEEILVAGPDELPLVLIADRESESRPAGLVTLSIVSRNLEASRRFYVDGLGCVASPEEEPGAELRDPACDLLGVPRGTRIRLLRVAAPGATEPSVLLVHVGVTHGPLAHPMQPGQLGMNLLTCRCEDLDGIEPDLAAVGVEPLKRPTHVGLPNGRPGRVMLVRGPDGELVELFDIAA